MFYFQQLFNTAMSGIDAGGATAGAVQVAQYVLLASFLFGIYEAWARGGDTRFLGAAAVRFFAMGLVMLNYGSAFRDVNGMFNNVANFIDTSTAGGGDVFSQWMADLSTYWNNNNGIQALWGLITGAFSGVLESLLLLVGYILFPVTYALFSLFYTLYGSILYVVGPFVLALYPGFGFGVMARKYLVNLMIFNAWGLLYAILGALMAAINMNSVSTVLNSGNFIGAFNGVTGSMLLGLASILLSLCIALIPFLAKRVVEGDVGQTMGAVISTTVVAAKGVGSLLKGSAEAVTAAGGGK
jgi:hypothetical protein